MMCPVTEKESCLTDWLNKRESSPCGNSSASVISLALESRSCRPWSAICLSSTSIWMLVALVTSSAVGGAIFQGSTSQAERCGNLPCAAAVLSYPQQKWLAQWVEASPWTDMSRSAAKRRRLCRMLILQLQGLHVGPNPHQTKQPPSKRWPMSCPGAQQGYCWLCVGFNLFKQTAGCTWSWGFGKLKVRQDPSQLALLDIGLLFPACSCLI